MYEDPYLSRHFFASFSDELSKMATGATAAEAQEGAAALKKGLSSFITKRDLGAGAIGAGLLYGGNRAVTDIRAGEQLRKQQAQGGGH
jgi:hypothetical protein